ncbi:uncharacterized protein VP01_1596g5 [Puccinia sorghi]|uniref:Uncharacterized protein n=1 Tax=Puccinia sorghi TaxID=27349 RepID=A0A0L6VHL5_9BASI|nr:uncharacterized protein VP01_1596g5 [Puccinia sorghi]
MEKEEKDNREQTEQKSTKQLSEENARKERISGHKTKEKERRDRMITAGGARIPTLVIKRNEIDPRLFLCLPISVSNIPQATFRPSSLIDSGASHNVLSDSYLPPGIVVLCRLKIIPQLGKPLASPRGGYKIITPFNP